MQLLALCLFICIQMTNVVEADGKDFVVKSQSLWRLCEELDDNLHLQQKLQLTDVQVKKVGLLLGPSIYASGRIPLLLQLAFR